VKARLLGNLADVPICGASRACTSLTRTELQPDLSTLTESGAQGFDAATWLGLLAPAATSAAVISFLNKEVLAVLDSPAMKTKLLAQGFTRKPMNPESFKKFTRDETVKFAELIKANNITVE
jgi:tripartite-type tricarboxylate transporter receptor subunit TctC